jgi:hypothetical protein
MLSENPALYAAETLREEKKGRNHMIDTMRKKASRKRWLASLISMGTICHRRSSDVHRYVGEKIDRKGKGVIEKPGKEYKEAKGNSKDLRHKNQCHFVDLCRSLKNAYDKAHDHGSDEHGHHQEKGGLENIPEYLYDQVLTHRNLLNRILGQ